MKSIIELINEIKEIKKQIATHFDVSSIDYDIVDVTEQFYTVIDGEEIEFAETMAEFEKGDVYSIVIIGTSTWTSHDEQYLLTTCYDGCGNTDMYIFSTKNQVKR